MLVYFLSLSLLQKKSQNQDDHMQGRNWLSKTGWVIAHLAHPPVTPLICIEYTYVLLYIISHSRMGHYFFSYLLT